MYSCLCLFLNSLPDADDCLSSPCQNGGKCDDLIGHYFCTCPPAFTGYECQTGSF